MVLTFLPTYVSLTGLAAKSRNSGTYAYAQKTIRTDANGRGSGRAGKGILDVYLAFRFGAKL